MFKGLVPLPIELPLSTSDSPPQQVGFLLSSCGVQVALTSESCLKGTFSYYVAQGISIKCFLLPLQVFPSLQREK